VRGCNIGITDGREYKLHRFDYLRCLDIHTKFHKDWFRYSRVIREELTYRHRHTDSKVVSKAHVYFFKISKIG
jgi:hypothetical protein